MKASNFDLADVLVAGANQSPQGTLVVSGDVVVGGILTADLAGISDPDGIQTDSVRITWLRDGAQIEGASDATYTVTEQDVDAELSVRMTYLDAFGEYETVTSSSDTQDSIPGEDPSDGSDSGDGTDGGDDGDGSDGGDGGGDEPDDPGQSDGVNDTPVTATPFNDVFAARSDISLIDGGDGVDTVVLTGSQSDYTLSISANGMSISDKRADGLGTITLENIERLDFEFKATEDASPMDLTQFSGHSNLSSEDFEAFIEMYIAYFNRAPDALGLAFWGTAYANGTTLEEIAQLFLDQDETRDVYPEDTSSIKFAAEVYANVLGRAPDLEGLQFWKNALDSGAVSQDEFILELLRGVDATPAADAAAAFVEKQQADQEYLEQKTDLGTLFAVHRGMSDVNDAANIMAMFDGSQESLQAAIAAIDAAYADAMDPENGEFLMPLLGVLDTPFDL